MKRILSGLLVSTMVVAMLSGCGGQKNEVKQGTGDLGNSYPLKTDAKLTYWVAFTNQASSGAKTFAELPFYKEVMKKTGVNVEFIHPVEGQVVEQYNIMVASGELPDIIENGFFESPGGPEKAISDEIIIDHTDAISKYAPNLLEYLKANPELDRMVKTDSGKYYTFPFIRGDKSLMVFQGPIVRKDWLDELGLQVPETIDEWYNVLKAFKDKKGATAPLVVSYINIMLDNGAFTGAYGTKSGLYLDNGKVVMGELQPQFKDVLKLLRKWYAEGLLDKNIASADQKTADANILDGRAGAAVGNTGSGIGKWMKAMQAKQPNFKLVPTKYPTLQKGATAEFGQLDLPYVPFGSASISSKSKNIELAARFLDYGYSKEGRMLFNFGIEGESYNMENGYPKYSDIITSNSNGKSFYDMLGIYTRPNGGGPYIMDPRYMEQYASMPEQKESLKIWQLTNSEKHVLPRITLTAEESSETSRIINDINTYKTEMLLKFITGVKSVDTDFDSYVEQLNKLGATKLVDLNQAALVRYNNR